MKALFEKIFYSERNIFIACYLVAAIITLAVVFVFGLLDVIDIASGAVKQNSLTLADFELVSAEKVDELQLITQTNDAQMILLNAKNIKKIELKAEFSFDPGEVVLFYKKNNQDYSASRMIQAEKYGNVYTFLLPRAIYDSLRIDTGIFADNTVTFSSIVQNNLKMPDIFRYNTSVLFMLLTIPGFAAAFVSLLVNIKFKKHKNFFSQIPKVSSK